MGSAIRQSSGAGTVRPAGAKDGRATWVIIAINIIIFGFTGLAQQQFLTAEGAMLALSAFDPQSAMTLRGVADGAYWRLVTSAFLHSSLLHIAFNSFALYSFGPLIESVLGSGKYLVAYLTMAVGASVFVYWLSDPTSLTVGASGAVFGLFGMALVLLIRAGRDVSFLIGLLVVNAALSFLDNISWQAHLGGFICGVLLGLAVALPQPARRKTVQAIALAVIWLGIVVAVGARTAMLS